MHLNDWTISFCGNQWSDQKVLRYYSIVLHATIAIPNNSFILFHNPNNIDSIYSRDLTFSDTGCQCKLQKEGQKQDRVLRECHPCARWRQSQGTRACQRIYILCDHIGFILIGVFSFSFTEPECSVLCQIKIMYFKSSINIFTAYKWN